MRKSNDMNLNQDMHCGMIDVLLFARRKISNPKNKTIKIFNFRYFLLSLRQDDQ